MFGEPMNRTRQIRGPALAAAFVLALVAAAGCGTTPEGVSTVAEGPATVEDVPYAAHDPRVAYVGADACTECHAEIAASYARTGMGRAYYPLDASTEVEDFTTNNIWTAPSGLTYRMEKRGGRYFMRQSVLDSRGNEIVADEREMRWVLGSGNHSRSYVTEFDGQLYQLPLCWYPRASRWDPCPGFEHDSDHFRRHATHTCVFCHNGRMEPVPGTISDYREPVPHGIGCERCHGPGEAHVARWKEGGIPTGGRDPTIVNPRRLPEAERIEVCFQCHLGDSKATERVATLDGDLLAWRPGRRLGEAIEPFRFAHPTRHDFGLSAQADRLVLSECFRESDGALECLTCHDPHVPVYDADRSDDFFNRRCRGCHDRDACSGDAAARQATEPPDDCTSCHMRRGQPDDQLHTVMTDHWIRRTIDDVREPRASLEIEPVIADSYDARPPGERAFYRGRADYLLSLKTGDPRRRTMWQRAEESFEEAASAGVDGADTWFFLGRVREYLGRGDAALDAFRRAYERDASHHDAALAYATALLGGGDTDRARQVLAGILADRPDHGGALAELARAHYLEGDLERALDLYRRAATVEPWNGELRANQAMFLAQFGRFDDARAELLDALALDPEHAEHWALYARILARLGRNDEAAEAAAVARRMGATDP